MPSPYTGIRFLDWVLAGIREHAGDLLHEGELFDERTLSFDSLLNRKLTEIDGITALVTLPTLAHVGDEPEDSDSHSITVSIYIRCNPNLTDRRAEDGTLASFLLAMKLYQGFNGTHFERDIPGLPANVTTTNLKNFTSTERGIEHIFEIRADITL